MSHNNSINTTPAVVAAAASFTTGRDAMAEKGSHRRHRNKKEEQKYASFASKSVVDPFGRHQDNGDGSGGIRAG